MNLKKANYVDGCQNIQIAKLDTLSGKSKTLSMLNWCQLEQTQIHNVNTLLSYVFQMAKKEAFMEVANMTNTHLTQPREQSIKLELQRILM